jgi:adenylate cyclase
MQGELVALSGVAASGDNDAVVRAALSVPIKLRGQVIGVLDLHEADEARLWTEHEIALAEAVAEQLALALESARLFEQTQARARREALTRRITDRIRDAMDVDAMLKTAIQELGQALGAPRVYIRLATDAGGDGE